MGRPLNRFEMRAAVEAAEAPGPGRSGMSGSLSAAGDRKESASRRAAPAPPRTRIVWAVCDIGGRTVTTFDYSQKADAEALIVQLKAKGKGEYCPIGEGARGMKRWHCRGTVETSGLSSGFQNFSFFLFFPRISHPLIIKLSGYGCSAAARCSSCCSRVGLGILRLPIRSLFCPAFR